MAENRVGRPCESWKVLDIDPTVQISSRGRVKRRGKLSKAKCVDKDGYRRIQIKGKSYLLHRLVAQLFIPNPDNLPVVDHINNVHDDNRVDNLRWCSIAENTKFAGEMGLLKRIKNDRSVVVFIHPDDGKGYMFNTVVDGCRYFDLDNVRASRVLSGKANHIKGFKLFRVNDFIDNRRVKFDFKEET